MTSVNHLVTGSNPVSGATFLDTSKTPINTTLNQLLASKFTNNDTIHKNYDTTPLRLYKVDKTFYYRRRIKQKLFRISLKTKNIKVALKRRKILDLIDGEEMFQIDTGDFKMMFEYDTEEELRTALESVKEMQIQAQLNRFRDVKKHISDSEENNISDLTFELLRDKYIATKKRSERVSADSIGAYLTTFKMLITFFNDKQIETLTIDDFEAFQDYLKQGDRKNKTVNKHIKYLKSFIKFAVDRHMLREDNVKAIILLDEQKDEQKRKATVANYTDQEVKDILSFKYDNDVYNKIFSIAIYTGMRISEIHNLINENIVQKDDIHYFNITKSKTVAGIRQIPIHKDILNMVLNTNFPLIPISKNAFEKKVRDRLYKIIKIGEGKNVHTLRGTFIQKAIHKNLKTNANITVIVQDIVGHTKNAKDSLTLDTYGKGQLLLMKKEIVDSVEF